MTISMKSRLTLAATTLTLAGFAAAQGVQAAPASALHGKKMAAQTVYVCKDCHAYFSAASAKKRGYKDAMGHTLVKESKAPAGYIDGSKM